MRSETPAGRIVNATIFERNGHGLLTMKLWRDNVIATLAIDGGIVFCFALHSIANCDRSNQWFELVGEEHRGAYEGK